MRQIPFMTAMSGARMVRQCRETLDHVLGDALLSNFEAQAFPNRTDDVFGTHRWPQQGFWHKRKVPTRSDNVG